MEAENVTSPLHLGIQEQILDMYNNAIKAMPLLYSIQQTTYKSTPYDVVYEEDHIKVLHYRTTAARVHTTPILIVYALVNRHYILDVEERSIIKNLLDQGFDLYLIDWGTPRKEHSKLTIYDYVNGYMDRCVDLVRRLSNSEKVTLLGYCMGGTFSAIYTALHKEKVRNLLTVAPSIDCSKDTTVFGSLARFLDADNMVDKVGNISPALQHSFFLMLKPFKHYVQKYSEVGEKISDKEFVENFIKLEKWLWDTPPIPGEVFRQWVKDIYQENLLAKNELKVGNDVVNISNIDIPVLNIVAEQDHLVSPQSSKALNYIVSGKDTTLMSFPTGHIGLCVSSYSQKEVWPKVGAWLRERSD